MKYLQIQLLILSIFTIISSCNFSQQNRSKSIIFETNQIQNDSAKLNDLFNAFLKKQTQINLIRYKVLRIDSLVSGTVRNNTGIVTLQKDKNDSIIGISFYGKRADSDTEDFYIDNKFFEVNFKNKYYFLKNDFGEFALNTSCGQLVLTDLIMPDTSCVKYSFVNVDNSNFALKTISNTRSSVTSRQLTIDKGTLVPNQITITRNSKKHNWKQSTTFFISNILINNQITDNGLDNLYFKTGYAIMSAATERTSDNLIGKKVPEIVLNTFKNQSINIHSLESQIVLLDFWELWCNPCKKSLPTIEQIAENYDPYGLKTFGIISDTVGVKAYLNENNISLNQAIGNKLMNEKLIINSYPRYVIIDKSGIIQSIYHGYSDNIELDINRLLFK